MQAVKCKVTVKVLERMRESKHRRLPTLEEYVL